MNHKKALQIIEILFPIFNRVDKGNGKIDYTQPLGYLLYVPKHIKVLYKCIWSKDNQIANVSEKIFGLLINLAFTILVTPIAFVLWCIGQLIFSMNYDKKKRSKGMKSNLFIVYSCIAALVIILGVMVADYNKDGEIQDKINTSINDTVDDINNAQTSIVTRNETKRSVMDETINSIITSEAVENTCVYTETTETTSVTTAPETSTQIIESDGYSVQRKSR